MEKLFFLFDKKTRKGKKPFPFFILICLFFSLLFVSVFYLSCTQKEQNGATESQSKLIFATAPFFPPMEFLDHNGNIQGFDIDFIQAVGKIAGFEVEIVPTEWDALLPNLALGQYDAVISSVSISEDRKKQYSFSIPYLYTGQILIERWEDHGIDDTVTKTSAKGTTTIPAHGNLPRSLKGKILGAQSNTTSEEYVKTKTKAVLKLYPTVESACLALSNKEIDGVIADLMTGVNLIHSNDHFQDKLRISSMVLAEEYYAVVVKKGNKKILKQINYGIQELLATQKYREIEKRWLK